MYLAIREMRFAKVRYSLIAAIMLLVAFLVLFVTGLAQGLAYDNASSIQNMKATHFIMEKESNQRLTRSQVGERVREKASAIAGEENAQPLGVKQTTVTADGTARKLDVAVLAVNPKSWLMPAVTEGIAIDSQSRGQAVVDDRLKASGIGIGTAIADQASGLKWTVSGFVSDESFSHSPAIFVSERDWLLLQGKTVPSRLEGSEAASTSYNAIAVKADKAKVRQLEAALPPGAEVVAKSAAVSAIPGYKEEQGSLLMMIVFLFVISAFVLMVFFYVITVQKSSQFGILKAIGMRTASLAGSVTLQVLLLSAGSLMISVLLVRAMEELLPSGMPFQLPAATLLLTCGAFMAMSLMGSLLSVWKVARIDALDAIGRTG
ncbi:ABC transporter permease [Paenibacillus silvisoli]|uniref:ABC transporter permease n=1 Tax=Paenibacillus silvisoli TaxID=3110539 RepID=UPI0028061DAA|nr:ABC transporter permease [Paenibacillus silvisoli]